MASETSRKHARVRARRTAVQALYQWEMTHRPVEQIISEFESDREELKKADKAYFRELLSGVSEHRDAIEAQLAASMSRPVQQLDPVERAILSLSMYELMFRPELPWRVVVNESVELSKMFGAEQSHRFVNGVMDAAARRVRSAETGNG